MYITLYPVSTKCTYETLTKKKKKPFIRWYGKSEKRLSQKDTYMNYSIKSPIKTIKPPGSEFWGAGMGRSCFEYL